MNTRKEHIEYIEVRGQFTIDCSTKIFSMEEIEILKKWGHWFTGLVSGELKPISEAQERFIDVINGEKEPFTTEEKTWFKYLGRKAVEKRYGDRLKVSYEAEVDTFYSREDKKKMNRINYGTICQVHNKGLSEK
ncbi:MAG: DUF413 domain-containing protein [Deltaproteobacteria bacterium]|nr:DUF413 domain-containing protein [Deltaproteobacteria bacterium]